MTTTARCFVQIKSTADSLLRQNGQARRNKGRDCGRYTKIAVCRREFCEKIGSSTSNMQSLMQGKRKLTFRYAEKVEKALGVGVDWLLFGTEEVKDYPCGDDMILFLKRNPEIRKLVWEKMKENGG